MTSKKGVLPTGEIRVRGVPIRTTRDKARRIAERVIHHRTVSPPRTAADSREWLIDVLTREIEYELKTELNDGDDGSRQRTKVSAR